MMDGFVADLCHHETDNIRMIGKFLDHTFAFFRFAERQIQKGFQPRLCWDNPLHQEPVVGKGKLYFDAWLRVQTKLQQISGK